MTAAVATQANVSVDGKARTLSIAVLMPLVYLLFGVTWIGFVPLLPEVAKAVDKPIPDAAFLIIVISWAKSFVPILAGILAARIGLTTTLRLGGVLILVGGIAPWLHDYSAAVAVRFVFGIGGALWVTLMGPVVLSSLPSSQRALANGANGVAVNAGIVVAYLVMLPLSKVIGVQWALTVATVATGACLVALSFVGKLDAADQSTRPSASVGATLKAYAKTLTLAPTCILAIAFCGPLALYLMLNTYLSQHMVAEFHVERSEASHWMVFLNGCGVVASLASGALLTRFKTPKPMLFSVLLVPFALAFALTSSTDLARAVGFALVSAGMFLPVSPLVTTVQRMPGQTPQSFGMIIGTMFAVSYVVSSAIPTAMGPLVGAGVPLGTMLMGAGLLGLTPLVGLLLTGQRKVVE